jgi:hypothetical protein
MTDEELKALVASLAIAQKETAEAMKETDRRMKETDLQIRETGKQLKELGKQIGGLGAKFGSFTEGMAFPSMTKILTERFGMEVVTPSVRVSKQGEHMEIDALAYANSQINKAYVVEVKSHARDEAIDQLRNILERFRRFFPEHQDKQVYGILAAVDISEELKEKALKAGFYVARIHDEIFDLDVPVDFSPQVF